MKQLIFILFLSPFLSFGQFEDAKSFSEGLAVVRTGGLWGAIDSKGNMVIEPIYQNLLSFKEGLAVAKKESLYGAINKKGEVIIDFKFSELSSFENGVSECEYEIDSISKYYRGIYSFNGLIDKKGNFFSNSLIHNLNKDTMPTEVYNWFLKEKKELIIRYTDFNKKYKTQYYGGVNYKGDTIIPFIYDKIETKTDNRYLLRNSDGWSLVTNKNETIVSANNGIRQISNFYEIRNRKNGKSSSYIYDYNGKLIKSIGNGWLRKVDEKENLFKVLGRDKVYYYMNEKFEKVIPNKNHLNKVKKYGDFGNSYGHGDSLFSFNDRIGLLNLQGKPITAKVINYSFDRVENFTLVELPFNQNGQETYRWFFINPNGKTLKTNYKFIKTLEEYLLTKIFRNGFRLLNNGRNDESLYRFSIYDEKGKFKFKINANEISEFNNGLAAIRIHDKWGYINQNGKIVIPIKYDKAEDFSEGIAIVYDWSKNPYLTFVINTKGDSLYNLNNSFEYIEIINQKSYITDAYTKARGEFSEGLLNLYDTSNFYVNKECEEVLRTRYHSISSYNESFCEQKSCNMNFSNGRALVKTNNFDKPFNYINKKGELISKENFNYAYHYSNNRAAVGRNNKFGFIDINGKIIIPLTYQKVSSFHNGYATIKDATGVFIIDTLGNKIDSLTDNNMLKNIISNYTGYHYNYYFQPKYYPAETAILSISNTQQLEKLISKKYKFQQYPIFDQIVIKLPNSNKSEVNQQITVLNNGKLVREKFDYKAIDELIKYGKPKK